MVWKSTITVIAGLAVILALAGQREIRGPVPTASTAVLRPTGTTNPAKLGSSVLPNSILSDSQKSTIMTQAGLGRFHVDKVYTMDWTNPIVNGIALMSVDHPLSVNTYWGGIMAMDAAGTMYLNMGAQPNQVFLVDVNVGPVVSGFTNGGTGSITVTVTGGGSKSFTVNQSATHVSIPVQAPAATGYFQLSFKGTLNSPATMFVAGVTTITTYK